MSTYITLSEAKAHLNVDYTDDNTYIQSLCDLVEKVVESEIQGSVAGEGTVETAGTTALIGTDANFLDFIVGDTITVKGETVRSIDAITDDDNLTVSVAFSTTDDELTYIMHMGLPLVGGELPLGLQHAMLLLVGHYYANRELAVIGVSVTSLPKAFDFLIAPFKHYTIS